MVVVRGGETDRGTYQYLLQSPFSKGHQNDYRLFVKGSIESRREDESPPQALKQQQTGRGSRYKEGRRGGKESRPWRLSFSTGYEQSNRWTLREQRLELESVLSQMALCEGRWSVDGGAARRGRG
jgi:hypothetical protein